jgi:hypothetical protein
MTHKSLRKRTRLRAAIRLEQKTQQNIQKAMTNDMRDSVLTTLSYKDNSTVNGMGDFFTHELPEARPNIGTSRDNKSELIDSRPLRQLHEILFPTDIAARIQQFLNQFCEKQPSNKGEYKAIASLLNQVINGAKLTLIFPTGGKPVRLRVISPAGSDKAYFQLRTANAKQQGLYTGIKFPPLIVS